MQACRRCRAIALIPRQIDGSCFERRQGARDEFQMTHSTQQARRRPAREGFSHAGQPQQARPQASLAVVCAL